MTISVIATTIRCLPLMTKRISSVQSVSTLHMGMGAFNKLTMHGISVVRGCHGNIEEVLKAYLNGSIADSAESCSHHDCGDHEEKPVFIIPNMK